MPGFVAPLSGAPKTAPYTKEWDLPLPRSLFADDLSQKPWAQRDEVERLRIVYGDIDRSDSEAWRRFRSYYFNCIIDMDRQLSSVLEALDATGQAGDTIIVFTSDHGERAGAHGLRQKGTSIYRENVHVPLIVQHPDVSGGQVTRQLSSALDLAPTLLGLIGVAPDRIAEQYPQLKGVDLSMLVGQPDSKTERDERGILFSYETIAGIDTDNLRIRLEAIRDKRGLDGLPSPSLDKRALSRGIYDGRYKFARYFAPSQHHTPETWEDLTRYNDLELYDVLSDPDEIDNLAFHPDRHKKLILDMNGRLNAAMKKEIPVDEGQSLPGPRGAYNKVKLG